MNDIETARQAWAGFIGKQNARFITFIGKVTKVTEAEGVCDVEPIDGNPEFFDVRLVPSTDNVTDGVVPVPKVGSFVVCGRLEKEDDVFIMLTSEISKYIIKCSESGVIELNGNTFQMVKGQELQQQINQLKSDFNNHLNAYNSHVHILTLTAGTGTAAPPAVPEIASTADFSQILNDKVKHGG